MSMVVLPHWCTAHISVHLCELHWLNSTVAGNETCRTCDFHRTALQLGLMQVHEGKQPYSCIALELWDEISNCLTRGNLKWDPDKENNQILLFINWINLWDVLHTHLQMIAVASPYTSDSPHPSHTCTHTHTHTHTVALVSGHINLLGVQICCAGTLLYKLINFLPI